MIRAPAVAQKGTTMKVLLISTNTLPTSPSGPAYVAGAVRRAGHTVEVYECLFAGDLERELADRLNDFQPDVAGISIRLVFGDVQDAATPLGTRHIDLRPRVREVVDIVRRHSGASVVLGGPGFNYYAKGWLDYLDVDCGICGEGEEAFPLFLKRVEDLDRQALPAYELFDLDRYAAHNIIPAIFTKRGCAFGCTYCPYGKLEGKHYRVKSPERVLAEIRHIEQHTSCRKIMFCDNSFNVPLPHATSLCRTFIDQELDTHWGTGDLKPIGVTDSFCRLLEQSGCYYVNLAIESASETMLHRMGRGYSVRQVRESLEALSRSPVPFGVSLMFGTPGETPETIAETLTVLDDYPTPLGVWVTLGVYLWTDLQDIVAEARQTGLVGDDRELFSGAVYLSRDLPRTYLADLVTELRNKTGWTVQVNKPSEAWVL